METALQLVAKERQKQIDNGYDIAHDSKYKNNELIRAACAIAYEPPLQGLYTSLIVAPDWAILLKSKYDNDELKRLTIAAAMIIARMEVLLNNQPLPNVE